MGLDCSRASEISVVSISSLLLASSSSSNADEEELLLLLRLGDEEEEEELSMKKVICEIFTKQRLHTDGQ